jgi:hypothetical protein
MRLTKRELNRISVNLRVSIPYEMEKELLAEYGSLVIDDDGYVHEFTEQDICEQLRKKLGQYGQRQNVGRSLS